MTKRIAEQTEAGVCETGFRLYRDSLDGKQFDRLMPDIISGQNITLAYKNLCISGSGAAPGADGKTIQDLSILPMNTIIRTVQNKLAYYQPKKTACTKDGYVIPNIWDRLIQQCILQILEPICEAKFHERNNGLRPDRTPQNAMAQCYKMLQIQDLYYMISLELTDFPGSIDHSRLIRQMWGIGIRDRKLTAILRQMLLAGMLFHDMPLDPVTETIQGGILSPLLANVVLNGFDWWIAGQWETFRIREGSTGYEFAKTDKNGNVLSIDRTQKWNKLREETRLKEMYVVRYADGIRIFCRDYISARKTLYAVAEWFSGHLHLRVDTEASRITNLRKNYGTFLGIKFKVVPKETRWIVQSHIAGKNREELVEKLQSLWRDIKSPGKQARLDRGLNSFNSAVICAHQYYCMATLVSEDFAGIAYRVNGRRNGMNHNPRNIPLERSGEITSPYIRKMYGKSRQLRWIRDRAVVPIGYVQYKYPKYKKRTVNKYVPQPENG